jgi:serine protease Do
MIPWKNLLRAAVLCSAAVLTLSPTPAFAQGGGGKYKDVSPPRSNPQFLSAFRKATEAASKSTVRVLCDDKEAALGMVIGPDGWILTKYSLLSGKVACRLKDGTTLAAKVVGIHEPNDLAMLKVEATNLPAVSLTPSTVAPVGNWLVSVGPGEDPVAVGVMSVATRTPPPVGKKGGFGKKGGGGKKFEGGKGGGKKFNNPPANDFLGITVTPDGPAAKVSRVFPQSAAARAGLLVDDKILSIQDMAVADQKALLDLLGTMKPGDAVQIKLVRDGKELELKATLALRKQQARKDQNLMGSELSARRTGFPTYFQSDTVIKPKDCGGPVCDLEGHVLGINIARAGRVESYSVPSEVITPLLADLMSGKLSPRVTLARKIEELKATLQKAEGDKAVAAKKVQEAKDALQKHEAEAAEAEKKLRETKDALDKAEKDLKGVVSGNSLPRQIGLALPLPAPPAFGGAAVFLLRESAAGCERKWIALRDDTHTGFVMLSPRKAR